VVSDTYITATVPSGASTGLVAMLTPSGTLKSAKFRVTPVVLSFSPGNGSVGIPVVITGSSFTGTTSVAFGGVKTTVFTREFVDPDHGHGPQRSRSPEKFK
jgi:ABC-type uncharacterized transport system permease subunit